MKKKHSPKSIHKCTNILIHKHTPAHALTHTIFKQIFVSDFPCVSSTSTSSFHYCCSYCYFYLHFFHTPLNVCVRHELLHTYIRTNKHMHIRTLSTHFNKKNKTEKTTNSKKNNNRKQRKRLNCT